MRPLGVLLALMLTGCPRVKSQSLELGEEASRSQINQALARAMSGISTEHLVAGQTVAYVTTRRIGDADSETTIGAATMTAVADPDAGGTLKLFIDQTERGDGGVLKTTRSERALSLDLSPARAAASTADPAPGTPPAPSVKYYRLRTAEETIPAPGPLAARDGCGGLFECRLPVRFVLFDVVAFNADGTRARTSMQLGFSDAPPYLPFGEGFDRFNGALVIDCRGTTISVTGRPVVVHECRRLVDFGFR